MTFRQIKAGKVSDAIAEHLEKLILEGVLRPGERLPPERELTQQLDVSRPSLREAIQRLELKGLVETKQGGGTVVRGVITEAFTEPLEHLLETDPSAAMDYVEFRRSIEATAAYYAAIRATESDRKVLVGHFEAMEEAHKLDDPTLEAEVDADFHLAIAEAAHNVILLHIAQGLFALLRKGVFYNRNRLYMREGTRGVLLDQHEALYRAVMDRNPDAARKAAESHMGYVQDMMREMGDEERREEISELRLARFLRERERTKPGRQA